MSTLWAGGGDYDAWAAYLEAWAAGSPVSGENLPVLRPQDFPPDGWERISNRLTGALSRRLKTWAEALTRAINGCGSEFELGRALAQARDGLREARYLTQHPGLPEDFRQKLLHVVDQQVESAQIELERQAERMRRSGARPELVEARVRTLRDNRLTAVLDENPTGVAVGTAADRADDDGPFRGTASWAVPPGASSRRRIIVD